MFSLLLLNKHSKPKNRVEKVTYSITFLFFALGIGILGFFLLSASQDTVEFTQTLIFLLLFIASYEILLGSGFAGVTGNTGGRVTPKDSLKWFFAQSPTISDLKYIPVGLIGLFAVSQIAGQVDSPLFGIFLSGIILSGTLLKTHSIVINIIIHGSWNAYVILANLQSSSPFTVPELSLTSDIWVQVLFQYFLVGNAEEMMRVVLIVVVTVALSKNNRFATKQKFVLGIAVLVSVIAWAGYHTVIATPIN